MRDKEGAISEIGPSKMQGSLCCGCFFELYLTLLSAFVGYAERRCNIVELAGRNLQFGSASLYLG